MKLILATVAVLPFTAFPSDPTDNLCPLEMWGGRQAHPAIVNSVTAIPGDPWMMSLRGEWEAVESGLSAERARADGKAYGGREGLWRSQTIHRVQVPGCLEDALKGFHQEPEKGRSWFCSFDSSPVAIRGFHYGETWYRKTVKLPSDWKGRRIWLKTGWTNSQGFFWINGEHVAFDWNCCETLKYDVTDLVRPGEREEMVVVQVNNAAPSHRGNLNSKNHWSGILRDIEFEATPMDCWIDDAWVHGDFDNRRAEVKVTVEGECHREDIILRASIDGAARTIGINSPSSNIILEIPLADFRPWSPEAPNLYTAKVELASADGSVLQTRFERFGVRKLEVRGKGVFLNGKPFFFRGAGWHPLDPIHGYFPADRGNFLKMARQIRAAGFNFVRNHTAINMPEFFEACDEVGLMVQPELPYYGDWSADGQRFDPCGDAEALYRHYRRYPSFAVYSFGNEGYFGKYLSRRLYEEVKSRDPDRLVNGQDCGIALRVPINEPGTSDFATAPWTFCAPGAWEPGRPYIYHEYINSSVKLDSRTADGFTGVWAPPISRADRLAFLEKSGLDHCWGDRLQNGQNLMQKLYLKYGLELARRDPNATGYSYWSLQDACSPQGGTFIGQALWNPFWGEKENGAKTSEVAIYNSPRCLLVSDGDDPDWYAPGSTKIWLPHLDAMVTNRVRMSGETLKLRFYLANYELGALSGAWLEWRLGEVASGKIDVGDQAEGGVRRIGAVDIHIPDLGNSARAELSLVLHATAEGKPVAVANSWDYWLFPKTSMEAVRREAAAKGVVVCAYGSDEEKRALAEGKRVISLANQSSPRNIQLGWWYMTEQMGAALMNCGWLKHVPHNGYFNELFFRIGRTGLKLPVEGFSQKDFVMVGEGGEACYLYLARRRLPNGARHYLIAGLDVTSDTPEGAALLRGAVEDIDRVSYAVSDFGKSADMFSASPRVFSQRNGDYRDGSHPITDGLVTFDLKNEYSLSIDNEIPVWGKPLEYRLSVEAPAEAAGVDFYLTLKLRRAVQGCFGRLDAKPDADGIVRQTFTLKGDPKDEATWTVPWGDRKDAFDSRYQRVRSISIRRGRCKTYTMGSDPIVHYGVRPHGHPAREVAVAANVRPVGAGTNGWATLGKKDPSI